MSRSHAEPLAQHYSQIAHIEEGGKLGNPFFISTAMVRLPNGHLVVASGRFIRPKPAVNEDQINADPGMLTDGVTVARSSDGGETWQSHIMPVATRVEVSLFVWENRLYMILGPKKRGPGELWIAVSDDEGQSWSEPATVVRGPHESLCSHQQSFVVRDGRLYLAFSEQCKRMVAFACDLSRGLLDPGAWRVSAPVDMPVPVELEPGFFPGPSMRCLEGNTIEIGGRLRVVARAVLDRYGTANIAAVMDLKDEDGKLNLTFTQFAAVPGGQCKFFIVHDEQTGYYWMASNPPANSQGWVEHPGTQTPGKKNVTPGNDRRFMMLWYSCDALNWFPAGCIARAEKLSQSFMYPVLAIDGDDLVVLSRTSITSGSFHDSELLTFHRVKDFRSLAMDIWPRD